MFYCTKCDKKIHGSNIIHNRDDLCEDTGGFTPSRHPRRVWYLLHCPCCLRAQPALSSAKAQDKDESASDENNDDSPEVNSVLPPPFSVVYHTTHLGRVDVLVIPRQCAHCEKIFGTKASEFACTSCATGSDWFGNELLDVYARINEGASFAVSWQSMYESHSAKSVERNEKPFTSVTAQNFTEAMKVFSAQRCDRRQLVHLQSVFKDCVSDLSCTCAVKTSLALLRGCAACGVLPLSSIHDGSHCIRSLHTSGRSYGPPLNRSVFSNESVDPESGRLRNKMLREFEIFRTARRAQEDLERKRRSGITPRDDTCTKAYKATAPLGNTSKFYDMTMAFMSSCSHFRAAEDSGLRVHTPGEGYINCHYQLCEIFHNSGKRPLVDVFGEIPEVLSPCSAFFYYDLCCKLMRTLELTDPDLYARIVLLLGKLHGESLLISQIKE